MLVGHLHTRLQLNIKSINPYIQASKSTSMNTPFNSTKPKLMLSGLKKIIPRNFKQNIFWLVFKLQKRRCFKCFKGIFHQWFEGRLFGLKKAALTCTANIISQILCQDRLYTWQFFVTFFGWLSDPKSKVKWPSTRTWKGHFESPGKYETLIIYSLEVKVKVHGLVFGLTGYLHFFKKKSMSIWPNCNISPT